MRRIIGAEAARVNPELADLVIRQRPSEATKATSKVMGQIVLASDHALANGGYRLRCTQVPKGGLPTCERLGVAE